MIFCATSYFFLVFVSAQTFSEFFLIIKNHFLMTRSDLILINFDVVTKVLIYYPRFEYYNERLLHISTSNRWCMRFMGNVSCKGIEVHWFPPFYFIVHIILKLECTNCRQGCIYSLRIYGPRVFWCQCGKLIQILGVTWNSSLHHLPKFYFEISNLYRHIVGEEEGMWWREIVSPLGIYWIVIRTLIKIIRNSGIWDIHNPNDENIFTLEVILDVKY